MSPDSRRTETAEQPHMGTLNLLPHSPREVSPPRNLSWEAGQHYGIGMPPNGQLALPQGPPGPMPPGPLFMPGQHMLVPHPSPPPQPPHVITKQTKDERPGFWLEGYHAGWREAHDVSIILPEDNSEVLAAISKSVTAVDSKVHGLETDLTRAIVALDQKQTADRAQTSAQLQKSIDAIEGQVQPIHTKIAQLTRSEREADKAWDEVHKLQTEFGIQQKKHEQEMNQLALYLLRRFSYGVSQFLLDFSW